MPPDLFPPMCSVLAVRSERNTRPDPQTSEIADPACAARRRGVHRFALDPPSSTCQINQGRHTGGEGSGRRRVGAEAGRRERGTMQRVGQEEGFGEVKGERRGEVVAARGRLNVRVESAGVVGFEREYWKEQAASSPQAGVDARLLVLVLALLPSSPLYRPSPAAGTDRFSGSIARRATPISWNACDTCNCCTTLFRSWLTLRQPDPTTSRRSRS